jgi:phosphoketolase
MNAIDQLPQPGRQGCDLCQQIADLLVAYEQYFDLNAQDLPEIHGRKWRAVP